MPIRLRAFLYALFALLVGGLAYLLGVGSFLGQRAEASVLDASAFEADPAGPLRLVSTTNVLIALAVIGIIALWVHGILRTVSILAVSSLAILASQVLKERWLDRPQLLEFDAANTFPSGHMTVYAVLVGALVWALPASVRWLVMLLSTALLCVVSWQLLEYGWHRPSDLLGALALSLLAFAVAAWIGPRKSRRGQGRLGVTGATTNRIVSIVLTIGGVLLVLGALVLAAIAASSHSDALMLNSGEIALFGASALTVCTLAKLCP